MGRARLLFQLPALLLICNENLSLEGTWRGTFIGKTPELRALREENLWISWNPWKPLVLAAEISSHPFLFPEPPAQGSTEIPYFLLLLSFLFSTCHCWLAIMEIIMVLVHGRCITGSAELLQGWAGKSLMCLSWQFWLQNCCYFLSCHEREGLHVLMAEMQTLHLSQNSLHMDLVKGCFCIPLQKASIVFLLVDVGLALVSFTLLSAM